MFFPEVTNRRSPITFAPVVRPTSCWIEPRYSTFFDITASWTVTADAGAAKQAPRCRQAGAREVTTWRLQRRYPLRLAVSRCAQEISTSGQARVRVDSLQQSRGQIRRAWASVLVVAALMLGTPAPAAGQVQDNSAAAP